MLVNERERSEAPATTDRPAVSDRHLSQNILYDALTQDKLELILFPTEKCNFRCTYCYEDFEKGRMSRDVIEGIKLLISARSPTLRHLHLSWFGGEPLIAYDIVTEILRHGRYESARSGFLLHGSVTTNGYTLTDERMIELAALNVQKIQISIDGDKDSHDKTRLRIDGAGTFDAVWSKLLRFDALVRDGRVQDCRIILRIHLHPANTHSVWSLVQRIGANLSPQAFSIHFKAVGHWGGVNDDRFEIHQEDGDAFHTLQAALYAELGEFRPEFSEDVYVCYAAKANSLTIRSDGSIGKCTVALNSKVNNIGSLAANGELVLDPAKLNVWLHALSSLDVADLGCPIARIPAVQPAVLLV